MFEKYKVILWDFDGVILNSNAVREMGFERVLADYPSEKVERLLEYHRANGGLSRYAKFRYFFEKVLNQAISEEGIQELATSFSVIMKELLTNPELLIMDTLNFIQQNTKGYDMYIISGSDQSELRFLCGELKISQYFKSINGSPASKNTLVEQVIATNQYAKSDCVLIGDSINDADAAHVNGIDFFGYNNVLLQQFGNYIDQFVK